MFLDSSVTLLDKGIILAINKMHLEDGRTFTWNKWVKILNGKYLNKINFLAVTYITAGVN